MNNKIRVSLILFISVLLITGQYSCSNRMPQVKPESSSSITSGVSTKHNLTGREANEDHQVFEKIQKSVDNLNHILLISDSCGHYHTATGSMPMEISDILDGFIVFYPASVYTHAPIMVLDSQPDPNNISHIGKIYYERVDDNKAVIHYLDIDFNQPGENLWTVQSYEIKPHTQGYSTDGTYVAAPFLDEMTPNQRFLWGYRRAVFHNHAQLLRDSLYRIGSMEKSMTEILSNGGFYVLKEGFNALDAKVNSGDITFDIGEIGDGTHYYHDFEDIDFDSNTGVHLMKCMKVRKVDDIYEIDYLLDCPVLNSELKSIFSSTNFALSDFPDDLIITMDELQ